VSVANRFIFVLLILSSTFIYFGCSSSSSSTRYSNDSDDSDTEKSSTRYSPNNNNDDSNLTTEDSGDLPDDDAIDIGVVLDKYNLDPAENDFETGTSKERMLMEIIKYLNVPYLYGGNSKSGIDCSAFTQNIYKTTLSTNLFRTARDQYKQGEVISNMEDLKFGDLVFFDTRKDVRPGHVGIYIGDDLFAHASTKKGVTISSITHSYYKTRFMGGRRIKPESNF
jgi:cell wall-associated NlpC family hydrolase